MTIPTQRRNLLAGGAALAAPRLAKAQAAFPSRPVRLLLGVPPGGAPDVAARLMADALSARWRQPVVVDNRPAGNGNIAAQAVTRGETDGHSLLMAQASILVLNEPLQRNTPYDTERDFVPISLLMVTPFLIAARPDFPANDLNGLRDVARARGNLTFASIGATNLPRFVGEMLKKAMGFPMTNVPYSSVSGAVQDTIAGRVDLYLDGTPVLTPQVRARQMKALAITSPGPFPGLEDIQPASATVPNFAPMGWFGLVGPKAMPRETVDRVAADMRAVLETREIKDRLLRDFGSQVVASPPADFARFLAEERALYRGLVRDLGVTVD